MVCCASTLEERDRTWSQPGAGCSISTLGQALLEMYPFVLLLHRSADSARQQIQPVGEFLWAESAVLQWDRPTSKLRKMIKPGSYSQFRLSSSSKHPDYICFYIVSLWMRQFPASIKLNESMRLDLHLNLIPNVFLKSWVCKTFTYWAGSRPKLV